MTSLISAQSTRLPFAASKSCAKSLRSCSAKAAWRSRSRSRASFPLRDD
jgi:hypothetical protein